MNKLNVRLKQLRLEAGLNATVLANLLGVHLSTYCGYEVEKSKKYYREPSIDKIHQLARYYDVSIDYITGFSDVRQNYDQRYIMKLMNKSNKLKAYHKEIVEESFNLAIL